MSPLVVLLAFQAANPYVRLGAAIPEADWEGILAAVAKPPAGTTPLDVGRASAERYAFVLAGLRKTSEAPETVLPSPEGEEASAVGRLVGLATTAAHVRFADGERKEAVSLLLDGLTMVRRTQSPCPGERAVFAAFATDMDGIPLTDCERIRKAVDAALPGAPTERATRLRLLRLHMRVEAYRWRYFKVPVKLADVAPEGETTDPASDRSFQYETTEGGYRLWSEKFGSLAMPTEVTPAPLLKSSVT